LRLLLILLWLLFPPPDLEAWNRPTRTPAPRATERVVARATPRAPVVRAPVVVALVDTGVDCNHPELVARCVAGQSFVDGVSNAVAPDVDGHGTMLAGIIVARSTARIMPIRLADWGRPRFAPEDVGAGIRWAADAGAGVIVAALATPFDHAPIRDAVSYACARGVRVVAAAGNHGTDLTMYPAGYPCVIAVGALGLDGRRAVTDVWASGYGAHVRVWRLGVELETTTPLYPTGWPVGRGTMSGTSAAVAVYAAEIAGGGW
jgi:subtilisin family serine protease